MGTAGMLKGYFVTGTDTGVGKTQVSCALLEAFVARGEKPFALKPYESGGTLDSQALWRAAGAWQPQETACLFRFAQALAPAMAATSSGEKIGKLTGVRTHLQSWAKHRPAVVEGAGGLYVPLSPAHDVIHLIVHLKLPVIVVARAGLGTINHTTLTLRALAARRVRVCAIVLMQTTRAHDASVRHNGAELKRRFPQVTILGPVPYMSNLSRRRAALRALLSTLLPP